MSCDSTQPDMPELPERIQALIQSLADVHRQGRTLATGDWASAVGSETQAYAVQDGVARKLGWVDELHPVARHWKSGAPARQGPYGHATLNPGRVSDAERDMPRGPFPLLGFEVEVALRLARPVTPEQALVMRPEQGGDWVETMCLAVELVASRWAEALAAPELLRLADHQSHAGLVLGPWQPFEALDWTRLGLRIARQDLPPIERQGGHSLADPAWLLPAWLQHLTRHGATVPAGTVVTTGAWGGLHALPAGQPGARQVTVSMERLGRLSLRL